MKKPSFQHKVQPFKHQAHWFEKTRSWEIFAFFWEMGLGKTKTLLDTISWLYLDDKIDGVIIIADKGNYLNWLNEEIPKHVPPSVPVRAAYWSSKLNKREKRKLAYAAEPSQGDLHMLFVNVEAFSGGDQIFEICKEFMLTHNTLMAVDESTSIKSIKAKRTNAVMRLGRLAKYRRIATGTPVAQSPLDLFAQFQFLKSNCLGHGSFSSFRSTYAILENVFLGPRRFMRVAGYQRLDELSNLVSRWSSCIKKVDCLDLPDKLYEKHYVDMTVEQSRIYNMLREEAVVMLDQGLLTSTNALTTIGKLHQIVCGHMKLDSGEIVDIMNNRISDLTSLLEIINDKVIIWCAFQRDVELIYEAIKKNDALKEQGFPVHYYGKSTQPERLFAIDHFTRNDECRWFIGTAATGGKGLTLVAGSTVIYYSSTYSLEDRLQSEDRAHRIGQKKNVTYIDMVCPNTVDQTILDALRAKEDLAKKVMDPVRLREILMAKED